MEIAKYLDREPNPNFSVNTGTNFYYESLNIEPNATVVFNSWYDEGLEYSHINDAIMLSNTSKFINYFLILLGFRCC